ARVGVRASGEGGLRRARRHRAREGGLRGHGAPRRRSAGGDDAMRDEERDELHEQLTDAERAAAAYEALTRQEDEREGLADVLVVGEDDPGPDGEEVEKPETAPAWFVRDINGRLRPMIGRPVRDDELRHLW